MKKDGNKYIYLFIKFKKILLISIYYKREGDLLLKKGKLLKILIVLLQEAKLNLPSSN